MLTRNGKRTHDDTIESNVESNIESNADESDAKKSKASIPRILDGKFFAVVKNENGKIEAVCQHCNETKKGHLTSTGNFKNHFRYKHPT